MSVTKYRMWTGSEMKQNHEIKHYELGVLQGTSYEMMPFTGLLDKSGVEIYEGDIVEQKVERKEGTALDRCKVTFDLGGYYKVPLEGNKYFTAPKGFYGFGHIKENNMLANEYVIGNIYQNPELLETE